MELIVSRLLKGLADEQPASSRFTFSPAQSAYLFRDGLPCRQHERDSHQRRSAAGNGTSPMSPRTTPSVAPLAARADAGVA